MNMTPSENPTLNMTLDMDIEPKPTAYEIRFDVEYIDEYSEHITCNRTYEEILNAIETGVDINAYVVVTGHMSGVWDYVRFAKLVTIEYDDLVSDTIHLYSATEFSWTPSNKYLRLIQIQYQKVGSTPINFGYIKIPFVMS